MSRPPVSPAASRAIMILQQYYFSINNISKNQSNSIKMQPKDTQNRQQKATYGTKITCNYATLQINCNFAITKKSQASTIITMLVTYIKIRIKIEIKR